MVYSKEVTLIILQDWAKGASAEETHSHLLNVFGKAPCLNTIYAHRNGLTAKDLVNELITQQQREITKQGTVNPELALKYRDSLIKTLSPLVTINLSKSISEVQTEVKHVIELVDPDNPAPQYPPDEVQAAQRAGIIPPIQSQV